ncbi:class I adenylate-forming enzyme family protein [Streptomyces sp. NPDC058045]|uniref:class I adenylate-forming enzyme family protein n=1 Tax=Streptomyces sp. NPDC058045 TaxID=3346311 RepID=UPI0036ED6917
MDTLLESGEVQDFLSRIVTVGRPASAEMALEAVHERLASVDIEPGRPVLVAMPNGPELLALTFALLRLGAVPTLIPPSSPAARTREMARRMGAGALLAPRLAAERYGAERPRPIGYSAEALVLPTECTERFEPGEMILMTSGTSGIFSGCVHHIDALMRNADRHAQAVGQRPGDTVLVNLPLHYSYAFVAQGLSALVRRNSLVVSGPPFTPQSYRTAIREYGVTVSSLTPALIKVLMKDSTDRLPGCLRTLTVGGDQLEPRYVKDLLEQNPELELYVTYGLTEAGPRVATLAAHAEPQRRHASVGLPLHGVRTSLRRNHPEDPWGELIVETDTVLRRKVGTQDNGERTGGGAASGRISTGDLFDIDDDGYLYFKGRTSDFLVIRGDKVSLPSVRRIAGSIPGVVRASTRVYEEERGDVRFDLDVHVHGPDAVDPDWIRKQLHAQLLRSERPRRIVVHADLETEWHK